jgi:hypothetical protein
MQGLVVLEPRVAGLSVRKGTGAVATADLVRRFTALIVAGMRAQHHGSLQQAPARRRRTH